MGLSSIGSILKAHEDLNAPVWSVNIMLAILLIAVVWVIVYILRIDTRESNGSNGSTESEELLQLPSDRDQPSP